MTFLEDLAARRRFGMKPGLDTIRAACAALGNPERRIGKTIHVAGTNGKGATCAILDACLGTVARVGRYTSPHLVKLNERFFLAGAPIADEVLERASEKVRVLDMEMTFFEALTAVAFLVYAEARPDWTILETGLGGRLDATNVCGPTLSIITRIGLDHCDWLGDTAEKIAAEKAGIIKPGVPVVLGRNEPSVRAVVERRARDLGSPFFYAPDLASESEIPSSFSLAGRFNRENAVTALAALKVLFHSHLVNHQIGESTNRRIDESGAVPAEIDESTNRRIDEFLPGFARVVWPGRFQRVGSFLIDGAHNPPAARALAAALSELLDPATSPSHPLTPSPSHPLTLIAGFCGDKDVEETLRILAPYVSRAIAVRTSNPRSLAPEVLAAKMKSVGIDAISADSLHSAIELAGTVPDSSIRRFVDSSIPTGTVPDSSIRRFVDSSIPTGTVPDSSIRRFVDSSIPTGTVPDSRHQAPSTLICGSLFLAGDALVELGACPWETDRRDASELLRKP